MADWTRAVGAWSGRRHSPKVASADLGLMWIAVGRRLRFLTGATVRVRLPVAEVGNRLGF